MDALPNNSLTWTRTRDCYSDTKHVTTADLFDVFTRDILAMTGCEPGRCRVFTRSADTVDERGDV